MGTILRDPMVSLARQKTREAMSLTFEIDKRSGYLHVVVTGHDSLADSKQMWHAIFEACRTHDVNKVLVVENLLGTLSIGETSEVVNYIVALGVAEGIRVAFVDKQPMQYAINKFAETIANNKGIDGKVFFTESAAQTWLLAE